MHDSIRAAISLGALLLSACGGGSSGSAEEQASATVPLTSAAAPQMQPQAPAPSTQTFSSAGGIDAGNPFFKAFGNGRSCASCHDGGQGWSINPQGLRARFDATQGSDPVFQPVDGANSPLAPVGTLDQKRSAYSMLLTKGVIRIGLPIPAGAQFTLVRADDPYGFASAAELSLFRRPLPSANLAFAAMLMWDGRESLPGATLDASLLHQANSAVRGHAQASADLSAAEQRAIVEFEKSLFIARTSDPAAGALPSGPAELAQQPFHIGINDVLGDAQTGAPFNRNAMTLFTAWRNLAGGTAQDQARAAIARGEQLFNNRPMNIVGVAGFPAAAPQRGSCTSCHNAPNSGSHSLARTFDTGVAAAALRTPDMPLYTLRNTVTGETRATTDPGSAMITGRWEDIGRFKTPNLRGASARAPFFHDGSAPDMDAVVRFYDRRFRMGLTPQEAADLAAFLRAL